MAIVKKRNEETVTALLLEPGETVELPPAEIDESVIILNSENYRPFLPELIDQLRKGTTAEPVAVVNDGATLAVEGKTRTFWVKLWHPTDSDLSVIERAQVVSCLPSNKNVRIVFNKEF